MDGGVSFALSYREIHHFLEILLYDSAKEAPPATENHIFSEKFSLEIFVSSSTNTFPGSFRALQAL